jgi:predicted ATPase
VEQEAEEYFLKALAIARQQRAKSLELRAVMSLVQLRQQSTHTTRDTQHDTCGNLDDAHRLLAEVYHWFTEGFETKDLQEAKALLDELR